MTKTAHCNLESLERIKVLSEQISAKEAKESEIRKEVIDNLEKVCGMLENVKMTKKRVLEEIKLIINKFS